MLGRVQAVITSRFARRLTTQPLQGKICVYTHINLMATKRLTVELLQEQYEFVRQQAMASGTTIVGIIRSLIDTRRLTLPREARNRYRLDPFCRRRGSFAGPADLAERHDQYLYGQTPG